MSERINITPNKSGSFNKAITVNGYTFDVKWYARTNESGKKIQNYEASTSLTQDNNFKSFESLRSPDKDLVVSDLISKIQEYMDEHDIRK